MKLSGIFYPIAALLLGGIILFVSLTKASLQTWAIEGNENRINRIPVEVKITTESGEELDCNYRLPEVKMMPGNVCYGAKVLRDEMWLAMTSNNLEKSKIALLLADKKMSEFKHLNEKNKNDVAIKSGAQALKKLEYGYKIIEQLPQNEETKKIRQKYMEAGGVYEQMLLTEKLDGSSEIINIIRSWNESRKKEI